MTTEPPYLSVSETGATDVCYTCCFYVGAGNSNLCPENHTADLLPLSYRRQSSIAVVCCAKLTDSPVKCHIRIPGKAMPKPGCVLF